MAATNCRSCGAALGVGVGRCAQCGALVKPPSIIQRLFNGLRSAVHITVTRADDPEAPAAGLNVTFNTTVARRFKVADPKTGELKEYASLEEMPPEVRARIEQALKLPK